MPPTQTDPSIAVAMRPPEAAVTPPRVRVAQLAALVLLLALIALGLAWELVLAPTGRGTLAIKVLPLVPCIAGLLRHRMVTFRWMSLLLWLYVLEGLVRATSESGIGRWLAIAEIGLCVALFACCVVYIRQRLGSGRGGADADSAANAAAAAPAGTRAMDVGTAAGIAAGHPNQGAAVDCAGTAPPAARAAGRPRP